MEGPALLCTPTHSERKQEAASMSVIPGQEVPGRWLLFNAAIIVTIVWIDNHAHYREMVGAKEGSWEALRLHVLRPWRSDGHGVKKGEGNAKLPEGCVLPLGCMGKLVCSKGGLHLI